MFITSVTAAHIYGKNGVQGPGPVEEGGHLMGPKRPTRAELLLLLTVFVLELAFCIWALVLAWHCGARHHDRFIHVVFALFFPILYVPYYFISGCGHFDGCPPLAPGAAEV